MLGKQAKKGREVGEDEATTSTDSKKGEKKKKGKSSTVENKKILI